MPRASTRPRSAGRHLLRRERVQRGAGGSVRGLQQRSLQPRLLQRRQVGDAGCGGGRGHDAEHQLQPDSGARITGQCCRRDRAPKSTSTTRRARTLPTGMPTARAATRRGSCGGDLLRSNLQLERYVDEVYNNKVCLNCSPRPRGPGDGGRGGGRPGINFDLATGGRVSGTINGGGAACANCELDLYDSSGRYVSYGYTNASGATPHTGDCRPARTTRRRTGVRERGSVGAPGVERPPLCGVCRHVRQSDLGDAGPDDGQHQLQLGRGSQIGGTITDALSGASLGGASASLYSSSLSYLGGQV